VCHCKVKDIIASGAGTGICIPGARIVPHVLVITGNQIQRQALVPERPIMAHFRVRCRSNQIRWCVNPHEAVRALTKGRLSNSMC
jgi:hypothetical protein